MSTSAPIKREYDIPIIRPQPAPVVPRELPAPDPERLVPIIPSVPVEVPVRIVR